MANAIAPTKQIIMSDMLTAGNSVGARRLKVAIDEGVVGGNQAITTQSFTELNSKSGTQYESAVYTPALTGGESLFFTLQVGVNPVLIKDVLLQFNSDTISTTIFKNPVVVNGGPIEVFNLNDAGAVASDVVLMAGVDVISTGTQVGPEIYTIGEVGQGNRAVSTVGINSGIERVLEANNTYMYRITNKDTNAGAVSGLITWYQGTLSTS